MIRPARATFAKSNDDPIMLWMICTYIKGLIRLNISALFKFIEANSAMKRQPFLHSDEKWPSSIH